MNDSMGYLPDTNVWIDIERGTQPRVVQRVTECASSKLWLSTVVLGEIEAGIQRSVNPEILHRTYRVLLHGRRILGVDEECASIYGRLRADLLDRGLPIGANDLWIAAQAIRQDLVLVTANEKEFSRVGGLKIENWR